MNTKQQSKLNNEEVFNSATQSALFKQLNSRLVGAVKQPDAIDAMGIFDDMAAALAEAGADQNYIDTVRSLKTDPDISAELKKFQNALDGEGDISTVGVAPLAAINPLGPTYDAGLNGYVLLGEDGDLLRYSNYISGAGTSVGGFIPGFPAAVFGLTKNSYEISRLTKVLRLEKQLSTDTATWTRTVEDSLKQNFDAEAAYRNRQNVSIDTLDYGKKEVINNLSPKERARVQLFETGSELERSRIKSKAATKTSKLLGKVGKGVKVTGSAFSIAQGGVSIAAGSGTLSTAWESYQDGSLSRQGYDKIATRAQLRIASGSLGIGKGVANISALVAVKVSKSLGQAAGEKASRFAPVAGNIIGIGLGALSITKNAMAADDARLSGNHGRAALFGIMAALDSVTLVLDVVSLALDFIPGIGTIVSFFIDLISTAIGFISDLIGFFTELVDTRTPEQKLQAEFDKYIESEAFKTYINSLADYYREEGYDVLTYYIDAEAASIGDDEVLRMKLEAKVVTRNLTDKAKENLVDLRLALIDNTYSDRTLIAGPVDDLISVVGEGNKILYGLGGDDELRGGSGNDLLVGGPGDDFLSGGAGNDVLRGGTGDDYLTGGLGADRLFGGEGDDVLKVDPYSDWEVDGGSGVNTLVIEPVFTRVGVRNLDKQPHLSSLDPNRGPFSRIPLNYFYMNLSSGQIQFGLDKLFELNVSSANQLWEKTQSFIDPTHNNEIYDAFLQWSLANRASGGIFDSQAERQQKIQSEIDRVYSTTTTQMPVTSLPNEFYDKTMWFLSKNVSGQRYFTDGENLYYINEGDTQNIYKSSNRISDFSQYIDRDLSKHYALLAEIDPDRYVNLETYRGGESLTINTLTLKGVFSQSRYLEAWLYSSFKTVTSIKNVTNINIDQALTCYITGDNQNNTIRLGHRAARGHAFNREGYVNTGEGNNTVVIEQNDSASRFKSYSLPDINGGAGRNTLVLTTKTDAQVRYGLSASYDFRLTHQKGFGGSDGKGHQIRGIQSIVLDGGGATDGKPLTLDTDINNLTITVNSIPQVNVTTSAQDTTVRIAQAGPRSRFVNRGDNGTIDCSAFSDNLQVNLSTGQITGAISASISGFNQVKGGRGSDQLTGNKNDNVLVAQGGMDRLDGKEGNNHLVSLRGRHELHGGTGNDIYTLHGSRITERYSITIDRDKDNKLMASGEGGHWQDNRLIVDLLNHDSELALDPSSLKIVNNEGEILTEAGSVRADKNNLVFELKDDADAIGRQVKSTSAITRQIVESLGQLVLEISGEVNDLERDLKKVIYVQYDTTGSCVTIDETSENNVIRLMSISRVEEIFIGFDNDFNLVIKDSEYHPILIDKVWGEKFNKGETSLIKLAKDFSNRFSRIDLLKSGLSLHQDQIYNLLVQKIKPYTLYDQSTNYVTSDDNIRQPVNFHRDIILNHDQSWLGSTYGGNDFVIANKYGDQVFGLVTGNGDDIIIATEGTQRGAGKKTVILLDAGNNTVIIGNPDRTVALIFVDSNDTNTVVINNWAIDQITVSQVEEGGNIYLLSVGDNVLSEWHGLPDVIAFRQNNQTVYIDNVAEYLSRKINNQSYQARYFLDATEKLGLLLPDVSSDQVMLELEPSADNTLTLRFKSNNQVLHELIFQAIVKTSFAKSDLSSFLTLQLPAGIQFSNQQIDSYQIQSWFNNVARFALLGGIELTELSSNTDSVS